jgi:hypothetical protein
MRCSQLLICTVRELCVTKSIRHNRISGGNNQLAGRESRSLAGSKCPRVKTKDVGFIVYLSTCIVRLGLIEEVLMYDLSTSGCFAFLPNVTYSIRHWVL